MAEDKKDTKKEIKTRDLTPEVLVNRQINYTIFKMLWHLKEDKKSMNDFYSLMGINRNRYRSIVTNDTARTPRLQEVAERLSKTSGVPTEVYLGKIAFSIYEIDTAEWKSYFQEVENIIAASRKVDKEYSQEECKKFENKLMVLLKAIPVTRDIDVKLYSAYIYFVYGETVNSTEVQVKLKRLVNQMRGITFTQLESVETEELAEYENQLKKQAEMIATLCSYRKLKNIMGQ